MRAGLAIEAIKGIKMTAIDKQMYEMAMLMRDIERKLLVSTPLKLMIY